MSRDLFGFWSRIGDGDFVHPADRLVFCRVEHGFRTACLPLPFFGPLRSAPVVLLFLSPGHDPADEAHAASADGRDWYRGQRDGAGMLADPERFPSAWRWCERILRQFGRTPEQAAERVAVLNIGAYHSRSFRDYPMLTALPSSRMALDWAQGELFARAERGERVVVCLRSARLWGLRQGCRYGEALFAPRVGQSGVMHHDPLRTEVVARVQRALSL